MCVGFVDINFYRVNFSQNECLYLRTTEDFVLKTKITEFKCRDEDDCKCVSVGREIY